MRISQPGTISEILPLALMAFGSFNIQDVVFGKREMEHLQIEAYLVHLWLYEPEGGRKKNQFSQDEEPPRHG